MSRHIGRNERWKKSEKNLEEYTSDFGIVKKDSSNKTWAGFVKYGFGYRACGVGFIRARDAMIAVEETAQEFKIKGSPLPPIQFPAHIFC